MISLTIYVIRSPRTCKSHIGSHTYTAQIAEDQNLRLQERLIITYLLNLIIISIACSTWVIMNQETRRLSKIPEQVRQEVLPFYLNRVAVAAEKNDSEKIDKLTDATAERIRSGLAVSVNT